MSEQFPARRINYGLASILMFLVIILIYILVYGVFEQFFLRFWGSEAVERLSAIALLVVPAFGGAVLGALGLLRPGQNRLLAVLGLILNILFGAFILCVLSIAG